MRPETQYRDLKGYPGYRVGDDGSAWSCLVRKEFKGKRVPGSEWKLLKPITQWSGHLTVSINRKKIAIHRLVLEAFVGPCPEGLVCRHFPDRNPANNKLSNLRWGTIKENAADRVLHGTATICEKHGMAKLTKEKVLSMRREYSEGNVSHSELSKKYMVSPGNVGFILNRQTWKNL